ncbi:MAG: LacI family transcriptional regulator [Candidatus Marinimicrobia bacterium]|nr:LacI family transcriptional regulator [Candidatus Neomarinimicrobiota bacterium]
MSSVTIKDIAKKLDIAPSTVSRALRDHPDVSKTTRNKVLQVANEMNYHPNTIAQSLKKGTSRIVGVLVPQVRHYFFAEIMAGIAEVAEESGYNVMICQSNEKYENEVKNVRTLIQQRIAGLLVSVSEFTKKCDHFNLVKNSGIPLVFFDRDCNGIHASKVIVDDYSGAFNAVEYLIESGYKRIAHLGGYENLTIARKRARGYKDALKKHNMPIDEELIMHSGLNEEDGAESFKKLYNRLEKKPDAIFAVTDPVAIGAYQVMKERGIKIPDDIALVGFSDNPDARLIDPPLTTVKQSPYDIGKNAMQLLLKQMQNKNSKIENKILKTELVIRESA